jgi:hypothetical protein
VTLLSDSQATLISLGYCFRPAWERPKKVIHTGTIGIPVLPICTDACPLGQDTNSRSSVNSIELFTMILPSGAVSLNPDTYLNHLSPQEAREYETTRNILLVFLGVSSSVPSVMSLLAQRFKRLRFGIYLPLSLTI